jgi:hypothetical protein
MSVVFILLSIFYMDLVVSLPEAGANIGSLWQVNASDIEAGKIMSHTIYLTLII